MLTWRTVEIGEILPFKYGKSLPERDRDASGTIDVISSSGVTGKHNEALLKEPCVVIGRKGSIGTTFLCLDPIWPIDTTFFVTGSDNIDLRFAYYLLSNLPFQEMNNDSAVPGLNRTQAEAVSVLIPSISEQIKIAETLGSLDDKIESNRRSMVLLDELVRTEFKRWRMQVSSLESSNFGAFAQVFGGATPKTSVTEFWDGELSWLTPTDVTKLEAPYSFDSSRTITQAGLASCAAVLHPVRTIFMTSRASIGAFAVGQVPSATNQGFIAVRPVSHFDLWFLFEEMRSRVDEFRDNANGSTFQELSRGRFKELPLEVPAETDRRQLFERLDPLHVKAMQLSVENSQLEKLRDFLIPKLLSGRIRVGEVTDQLEEVL